MIRNKVMKQILSFLIFVFCFGLNAQEQKLVFPKVSSQLTIPVSISVDEINSLINRSINGILFEDDSFTDNDNDQFKVKVIKNGDIRMTVLKNNRLLIDIPLYIYATQGYGGLGYYVYQSTDFGVRMKFITSVEFNNNWTLNTNTESNGFEWTDKPVLNFSGFKIPIAPIVEKSLRKQQSEFTEIIDEKIAESFDLKPYLLTIWNQFANPIEISEEYNSWLKITPVSVDMTPVVIYSDYIKSTIGLNLFSETFVGQIPLPSMLAVNVPNFSVKPNLSEEFKLKTTANIPYDKATELARQQFLNYEFEMNDKKKVRVEDIRVFSGKQSVVIEIRTSGAVNGLMEISGFPYYDAQQRKIRLKDTRFKLKTKNLLHKAGLLFFKGKIRKMIEDEYGIPMNEIEDMAKKNLLESFNKEYYPGIFLKGRVIDIKPSQILLFDNYITLVIDTKASLKLDVKELNF